MAFDLVFGRTARDWSCGGAIASSPEEARRKQAEALVAKGDAQRLAEIVRAEAQANANKAVLLTNAGKLPVTERKAFGAFMRKWTSYAAGKNMRFGQEDFVRILQFRAANRRFTERLAVFEKMAATPPAKQAEERALVSSASTANPSWLSSILIGAGAAVLGLILFRKI